MMRPNNKRDFRGKQERQEFDQTILDIARVTRVTKGGKHMSFRTCVVLGDRHGRVGYGLAKGKDVQGGVEKGVHQAKKKIIRVPIVKDTIPHTVISKFKAAEVLLMPAPRGSGIIAGGAVRVVLEMAGIPNVSSKILGKTKNKIALVKATFEALKSFKRVPAHLIEQKKVEKSSVAVSAPAMPTKNQVAQPARAKKTVAPKKDEAVVEPKK